MRTFNLSIERAIVLTQSMAALMANPTRLPKNYFYASVEDGVGMLVEPATDHPFVFIVPNTVHQFESAAGDSAAKLRQHVRAAEFFAAIVAQHHAAVQLAYAQATA